MFTDVKALQWIWKEKSVLSLLQLFSVSDPSSGMKWNPIEHICTCGFHVFKNYQKLCDCKIFSTATSQIYMSGFVIEGKLFSYCKWQIVNKVYVEICSGYNLFFSPQRHLQTRCVLMHQWTDIFHCIFRSENTPQQTAAVCDAKQLSASPPIFRIWKCKRCFLVMMITDETLCFTPDSMIVNMGSSLGWSF